MTVPFSQIDPGLRVPLFYAEVDDSAAGLTDAAERTLLVGQVLAAGSAVAGQPVRVFTEAEAWTLFGAGSVAARMAAIAFANDPAGELWVLPLADAGGGVKAEGDLTVAGTATAAGTLSLYLAGIRLAIPVASGDTATEVGDAIVAAVTAAPGLPVAASNDAGTVTLTAKNAGTLGNGITVAVNAAGPTAGEATPAGLTVTPPAGGVLAGGATDPDLAAAYATLGDEPFDFIVQGPADASALDAADDLMNPVDGRWAPTRRIWGHVFAARTGSVGTLAAFGQTRNGPHVTLVGYQGSLTPPEEIAAAVAAKAAASLRLHPARPLQYLALSGVRAAPVTSRFTLTERNTLLGSGIATLRDGPVNTVAIERLATTFQTNATGQPSTAWLDLNTAVTNWFVLRRLEARIVADFQRCVLFDDGHSVPEGPGFATPGRIKAALIAEYQAMAELGWVEGVATFADALIVERSAADPNRIDVAMAPDLANQLRVFALLYRFRLQA